MRSTVCAAKSRPFRPKLKSWSKLKIKQNKNVLLYPEGHVVLNDTAYAILQCCDGKHTTEEISNKISYAFNGQILLSDVEEFIDFAKDEMWIV